MNRTPSQVFSDAEEQSRQNVRSYGSDHSDIAVKCFDLNNEFGGKRIQVQSPSVLNMPDQEYEILYFWALDGEILCKLINMSEFRLGRFKATTLKLKEVLAHFTPEKKEPITLNPNGTYEINRWSLDLLTLSPHPDLINAYWIFYDSVKLGMLTHEIIGEADRFRATLKSVFIAMALNSNISFESHDSIEAATRLMLNGKL